MLPIITVLGLGSDIKQIVNTRTRILPIVANLAPGTATNLFENLGGELFGTIFYKGDAAAGKITKFVFSVAGHGTNQAGISNDAAILRFKVVAVGAFTPSP